jgi:ElaB/YqjD/DUF883 family membrane-anchored ribosome-binding protein
MPASSSRKAEPTNNQHDVGDEIAQIKNDIVSLGKSLSAFGKDRIGSQSTAETLESARQALKEIRDEMTSIEHDMERKVTEHPMQSLLIAAGLGFLAAYLVRR